jgi:hypothetical protein
LIALILITLHDAIHVVPIEACHAPPNGLLIRSNQSLNIFDAFLVIAILHIFFALVVAVHLPDEHRALVAVVLREEGRLQVHGHLPVEVLYFRIHKLNHCKCEAIVD